MQPLRAWVERHCLTLWDKPSQGFEPLKADGSDRRFYRVRSGARSLVVLSHPGGRRSGENDAFVAIGRHLRGRGISVPTIHAYKREEGWVLMEDLGDLSLQQAVSSAADEGEVLTRYGPALDELVNFQLRGASGFETAWCYQGARYDERVMLEGESQYFLRVFLKGYLGWQGPDEPLLIEFRKLARMAAGAPSHFLIHRDFQSRNVLLPALEAPHLIDFQGARWGPPQYDVAALIIDPYVSLTLETRKTILSAYLERLAASGFMEPRGFMRHYPVIALHRNLQILGAFAFLGQQKDKPFFLQWIPAAISHLTILLDENPQWRCPRLRERVREAQERVVQS